MTAMTLATTAVWGLAGCSEEKKAAATADSATPTPALETAKPAEWVPAEWLPERDWRAVWVERDAAGTAVLTGLESGAGKAPRVILTAGKEIASISRPLLDSAGEHIIFTDMTPPGTAGADAAAPPLPAVWRVAWDGSGAAKVGAGAAVEVWKDPGDGADYIYAMDTVLPARGAGAAAGETMMRFTLGKPGEREIVWTETAAGLDQFQLSADGTRGAGVFPWPRAALAVMADHTLTPVAHGSWASLAPDDSYAAWVLDGSRRRLRVFAPNLNPGWELNFSDEPAMSNGALGQPRWSNDPLAVIFTRLDPTAEDAPPDARAGDVMAARLRDDMRRVEALAPLTSGRKAMTPDLWVKGGAEKRSALPQKPVVETRPPAPAWPVSADGLVWAWENAKRPDPAGQKLAPLTAKGGAVPDRYFGMGISSGVYEADPAVAARLAAECAPSGAWALELILTERRAEPPVSTRLAVCELPDGRTPFALYRVDRKLVLRLLLGGGVGEGSRPALEYPVVLTHLAIEDDRPAHVLLSLKGNRLGCYVDGRLMKEFQLESAGLGAWAAPGGRVFFGDPDPYGTPWTGSVERVALYSRALAAEEIADAAAAAARWTEGRKRPARVKLRAKLIEAPAPASDAPRLLSLSLWEAGQVDIGSVPSRRFALQSWSRLDGQAVANGFPAPGEEMELWMEPLDAHPETEGETVENRISADDVPVYFDSAPPGRRSRSVPAHSPYR